jgi:hypothetical protein
MLCPPLICPWLRRQETCCGGVISSSRISPQFLLGSGDLLSAARCLQVVSISFSPKRVYHCVRSTMLLPRGSPSLCWLTIAIVPPYFFPVEYCALCGMVWWPKCPSRCTQHASPAFWSGNQRPFLSSSDGVCHQ